MGKYYLNMERPHLMNPAMNIIIKADFKGKFDEKRFRGAVKTLTNTYGILGATVQMDEKGRAYFLAQSAKPISVKVLDGGASFERLVSAENQKPFKLSTDSMLRIFVISAPCAFSIIFISHHLLGDGKSNLLLVESLAKIYMGEEIPYVGIRLLKSTEQFPKESEPAFLVKLYLESLNKQWRKQVTKFTLRDYEKMFKQYHKERETALYTMTLNAVELRKLSYRCKQLGITINSAVVAAFVYAKKELIGRQNNHKEKVGIAIDLRDELNFDASRLIGNYASAITIEQRNLKDEEFDKFMLKIHNKLLVKIKNPKSRWLCLRAFDWLDGTLMDSAYFCTNGNFENKASKRYLKMMSYDGKPEELGVTNLGKTFMRMPEGLELESIMLVPPASLGNDITVGVVTYQGVMELAVIYQTGFVRKEKVQKIAARVKELLLEDES